MDIFERILKASELYDDNRPGLNDGGMLVKPSTDGSRPGYRKDNPGSVYKDNNGYTVKIGSASNPNTITKYFGAKRYGSLAKAKKAAEAFRVKEAKNFQFLLKNPNSKQAAAEKAIQELLDEGKEITTAAVKEKLPKDLQKDFSGNKTFFSKAKKSFPNLDFKKSPRIFLKTPKEIARVSKLIEDGLPLKEIQAKGFDVKFIKRVAKVNNLKIAETSREYFENVKKITKDLTKIGKNKKIVEAFENGTVSKDLIDKVGKVTKSNDPFYDSRLLFKLAEYYDGSLEEWYKPRLPKPTSNQITNSDKVIKSSATFLGGKRNGYAYQNFLYDWGAKKIDKVLDLPLGTFRGIQRDIARTLPSGVSLDEVFGVKSSGRFSPIEGILTNPLESGANVDKGSFVDNIKSNYQSKLIEAAGNPEKQKEILKEYNDVVQKSKIRYPEVEFPNYKVGQPPNKTIKGFDKLPPLIQNKLLENYKTTGISPITKKAVSIFDVAKATGSKTFQKLDKNIQSSLSNISSQQGDKIKKSILQLAGTVSDKCKVDFAQGGRVNYNTGSSDCLRIGREVVQNTLQGKGTSQQKILTQRLIAGGKNFLKSIADPRELVRLRNYVGPQALGLMAAFEGGAIGYDNLVKGTPANESLANQFLLGIFAPYSQQAAEAKNLLESGKLSEEQRASAQSVIAFDNAVKKAQNIEQMEQAQGVDIGGYGKIEGQTIDPLEIARIKTSLENDLDKIDFNVFDTTTGKGMEYRSLADEKAATQMAKKAYSPLFGNLGTPLTNKLATAPRVRGPRTMQQATDVDLSLPTYDRAFTPTDKQLTDFFRSEGDTRPLLPGEGTLIRMQQPDQVGLFGTQERFAGGGIAGLSGGVNKGPAPESGPASDGLLKLFKRVRNY